jgi:hypothetical protein
MNKINWSTLLRQNKWTVWPGMGGLGLALVTGANFVVGLGIVILAVSIVQLLIFLSEDDW